jgi:glutamine synthetase
MCKIDHTFLWTDTETGPGVLETALAYTSALRMADNAILFKYLAKSIGMKHGVVPSFMAKPWGNVGIIDEHITTFCYADHWNF